MTDDVREIVGRLTKAQRAAMLWLPADGTRRIHDKAAPREVSFWTMANIVRGDPSKQVAQHYKLCRKSDGPKQPGRTWPDTQWQATPLGLRVRALLQQQDTDNAE